MRLYTHDKCTLVFRVLYLLVWLLNKSFLPQKKKSVWPRTFIDIVITWYININVLAKCESSLRLGIVDRITKHQEKSRKR